MQDVELKVTEHLGYSEKWRGGGVNNTFTLMYFETVFFILSCIMFFVRCAGKINK